MLGKIYRLGILLALSIIFSLGVVLVVFSYSSIGVTSEVGTEGLPLLTYEQSAIPQSVIEDASELATSLFGDGQENGNNFVSQLLATYSEAKDKDFILLFNSGGWGWNLLEDTQGWESILNGVKDELNTLGYKSLVLDYKRTEVSWRGRLDEMAEMAATYPKKAQDLASRVEFLTQHIPDIKVILAGESNGTVISDRVMAILRDNPQVYSIQTGPPFWHKHIMPERTLVLTGNGINPDYFSRGDWPVIIWRNLKSLFGSSQSEEDFGTIFLFVKAPGHDYQWQYPEVYTEITQFLKQNFSLKW